MQNQPNPLQAPLLGQAPPIVGISLLRIIPTLTGELELAHRAVTRMCWMVGGFCAFIWFCANFCNLFPHGNFCHSPEGRNMGPGAAAR